MTVTTNTNKVQALGNGATKTFPYSFRIYAATDLVVTVTDIATGVDTDQVLNTDYTVTGAGSYNGGNVVFVTAPANNTRVTIRRVIALTQGTDLRNQGSYFAETHEDVFDRQTMVAQQQQEQIDRSFQLPGSVSGVSAVVPFPSAGKSLKWNESGTALVNSETDPDDVASAAAASAAAASASESAASGYAASTASDAAVAANSAAAAQVSAGQVADAIALRSDLAAVTGASLVGVNQSGTGATSRTVQSKLRERISVFDYMSSAQIADVQGNTAAVDVTAAVKAAVAYLVSVGGGELFFPRGTYLLNGEAGLDTYKNGILLPDTGSDFSTRKGITLVGEGTETILKAGSTGMIVVRSARLYSGVRNLKIDGASLANVIGAGLVPESLTQTTELVSQSYQNWQQVYIENCTEGMLFQPGPDVAGAGSGAFYHAIDRCVFNQNTRHVWMKKDVTAAGNRTTRTSFNHCIFTRGNTGVQIDGGTEIDFVSCWFEMINSGTSPNATPVAFYYADSNPSLINLIGGFAEACTKGVVATSPEWVSLHGFEHTSVPDSSQFSMNKHVPGRLVISKFLNQLVELSFGNGSFVSFQTDPDQTGQKTLALKISGTDKERWNSTGSKTFYGSAGNITTEATGAGLTFSRNGSINITANGGASAALYMQAPYHGWQTDAGVNIFSMTQTEFIPRVDNATVFGTTGLRLSAIWAANGAIQTSDPRTKKDIHDSPLGLDFITKLRPVAYRFKVGSNKVVGDREVKPAVLDDDGNVIERAVMEPIVEPQPGKRLHYGFLTTEVKAALDACGVEDFGGWIKTNPDDPESEEALRYDEFISPMVRAIQELAAQVADLKAQLAAK